MSNLLRQTVNNMTISESPEDASSSSSSSDSSADSAASIDTVRPSSREQVAPAINWTSFFAQELYLHDETDAETATYHVYLTPPTNPKKDPLFICHHGAGASAMSFAIFARDLRARLPEAGILALQARGHGSVIKSKADQIETLDYSLSTLASNALRMIRLTQSHLSWPTLPPSVLVGHSLGGAIVTQLAADFALGPQLIGFCVLDVVEGSAVEALGHMNTYLASRPQTFPSIQEAITWHLRSRTLRNRESAEASVPSMLIPTADGKAYTWKTNLKWTETWWSDWFDGMSKKFLAGRGAKLLILAGTDRLDKDLMIGQMQGKFQLVVLPEAGHWVQEDVPDKTAGLLVEFFKRNDRSALVLPPKVSELLAMGKKV